MLRNIKILIALLFLNATALAQTIGPVPPSNSAIPSGPAGGDLFGTYPDPTIKSSVTLITPNIGNATGTSLILSGTITAANLAVSTSSIPTNGVYLTSANTLGFSTGSTFRYGVSNAGDLFSAISTGPLITYAAPSATVPAFAPNRSDVTTGIGAQAAGNISLIAGGAEIARATATAFTQIAGQTVLKSYTVGTLPTGIAGGIAYVTDASVACTFLTAPAGGGSNVCPVFYNGTAWVAF